MFMTLNYFPEIDGAPLLCIIQTSCLAKDEEVETPDYI